MLALQTILAENPPDPAAQALPDNVLVRQAQQDLNHFAALYRRHVDSVYRYLLVRVGNPQDAQDLTSQTFLAAMESLPKYRGDSPFVGWLFGIARFKSADFYRRRKPEAELNTAVDLAESVDSADEIVGRQLQIEQVAHKLDTLAPDRAEALRLRLFAGLDVPEIARLMDRNEPAVRMLVFRGLRDLQAQLAPDSEDEA